MNQAVAEYSLAGGLRVGVPGLEHGMFEVEVAPSPVRRIAVTAEMQEADRQARAQREAVPESSWTRFRSTLSEENLKRWPRRTVSKVVEGKVVTLAQYVPALGKPVAYQFPQDRQAKAAAAAKRATQQRRLVKPAVARVCARCPRLLSRGAKGELCRECLLDARKAAVAPPSRCACGAEIDPRAKQCRECTSKTHGERLRAFYEANKPLLRHCACGRRLKPGNKRSTCWECNGKARRAAQVPEPVPCVKCGRPRPVKKNMRKDGLCGPCGSQADIRAKGGAHRRLLRRHGVPCAAGCGRIIKPRTKTGRCVQCKPKRSLRTVLRAKTVEEHRWNQVWAELSGDDKEWVFAMAGGEGPGDGEV